MYSGLVRELPSIKNQVSQTNILKEKEIGE